MARDTVAVQRTLQRLEVQRCDGLVADDEHVTAGDRAGIAVGAAEYAVADEDVVASAAQLDAQRLRFVGVDPAHRRRG